MKVLVTGGAGYIGSFMTKALLDRGDEVVVADSLERGYESAVDKRAKLKKGNLLDEKFVLDLFNESFDSVIHFAGYISMKESVEFPSMYFRNNIFPVLNILDYMSAKNLNNFIFSSTAGVYGNPVKLPIPEDHRTIPTNPYGESKLIVEKILSWFEKEKGLNFMSLRYFNASGAALDGSLGEAHQPETHIIPNAIRAILEDTEFKLFGTDYETPDGTCIRDYIHVLDLVGAHIKALDKLVSSKGGFFYNVGTGKGFSNREVLDMVQKVSGKKLKIKEEKRRPGDSIELVADVSKIKKELNFEPKYSDLETIVKTAFEWHSTNV